MSINRNETILGITGLQKYYGKNHVLKGIDLNIHRGEVVAIIGQSGSGKSALLRCMNGLEEYQEGQIIYNGELTSTSEPAEAQEISRSIGIIFQQFNLVDRMSVFGNVCLGALHRTPLWRSLTGLYSREVCELAQKSLARVGILDKAAERTSNLSGGQQQRAAIARALVQKASVLLADEPIASLDPATPSSPCIRLTTP